MNDTERRYQGNFPTPETFVKFAYQIIEEKLGENWKEEYVIYAEADWDKGEYCVTIQNMFDKATYFKQYELEEVSPVATDFITGFEINEEGDIIIVYPSGDDFDEKELILQIQ